MDFSINDGINQIDTTMNLNYHQNNPSVFGGYSFEIQNVIPYPELGKEINLNDVRVVMQLVEQ